MFYAVFAGLSSCFLCCGAFLLFCFFLSLLLLVINGITGAAGVGRVPTALRVICTLLISVHFSVLYLFKIVGLYFVGAKKRFLCYCGAVF